MQSPVILRLISFFILFIAINAQNRSDQYKYQQARQYITANKHSKAYQILAELYKKFPQHSQYRIDYKLTLEALGKYSELIKVVEYELLRQRNNPLLYAELAAAYHKLGAKDKARKKLDELENSYIKVEFQYTQVANIMIRNKLYEYAIRLYRNVDKRFNKNGQYLYNIAYLYQRLHNYIDAFKSYINYLKLDQRRYQTVSRQILSLMDQEESKTIILKNIDQLNGNEQLLKLKIIILLAEEKYSDVFKEFRGIKINDEIFILDVLSKIKNEAKLEYGIQYLSIINSYKLNFQRINIKEELIFLYFTYYKQLYKKNEIESAEEQIDSLVRNYGGRHRINFKLKYIDHLLKVRFDTDAAEKQLSSFIGDQNLLNQLRFKKIIAELDFYKGNFSTAKPKFLYLDRRFQDGWATHYLSVINILTGDSVLINNSINKVLRTKGGLKNPYLNNILKLNFYSKLKNDDRYKDLIFNLSIANYRATLDILTTMKINPFILEISYNISIKLKDYIRTKAIIDKGLQEDTNKDFWLLSLSKWYIEQNMKEKSRETLKKILLEYTNSYYLHEARSLYNQI